MLDHDAYGAQRQSILTSAKIEELEGSTTLSKKYLLFNVFVIVPLVMYIVFLILSQMKKKRSSPDSQESEKGSLPREEEPSEGQPEVLSTGDISTFTLRRSKSVDNSVATSTTQMAGFDGADAGLANNWYPITAPDQMTGFDGADAGIANSWYPSATTGIDKMVGFDGNDSVLRNSWYPATTATLDQMLGFDGADSVLNTKWYSSTATVSEEIIDSTVDEPTVLPSLGSFASIDTVSTPITTSNSNVTSSATTPDQITSFDEYNPLFVEKYKQFNGFADCVARDDKNKSINYGEEGIKCHPSVGCNDAYSGNLASPSEYSKPILGERATSRVFSCDDSDVGMF
ncbi:hypothetical protein NEMIN01_0850 [Nematocida minor]|uniref:uncharacterized protein n=1 Tax=Nematocida minor TaxID=1912983 RepID=UPI0022212029|nr:uncharacterized protein NEMIN01_0850 [Nematocida minor]KAI5190065.1 hypothetical protein NEMIN01_0850 [Nematocida minor]